MKRLLSAALAAMGWIGTGLGAVAPTDLLVQVEWIEVRHETVTSLMEEPALVADGTKLRERLQELVARGKASIFDTAILCTRMGRTAVVESHREWIYPTEVYPPVFPAQVDATGSRGGETNEANPLRTRVPQTPFAFETSNVGSVLEVEGSPGPEDGFIRLQFAVAQSRVTRILEHGKRKMIDGTEDAFRIPEIETLQTGTSLVVPEGGYVMAGVLARKEAPEKRFIVMVRCDVLE